MTKSQQKQIEKFKEAARELETDDREEAFDERLKRIAKAPKDGDQSPKKAAAGRRRT